MTFSSVNKQREMRLLGRAAAATYLDMTPRSLDRLVGKGLLRPIKILGLRRVMFDRIDLDALIDASKARALGETPEEGQPE